MSEPTYTFDEQKNLQVAAEMMEANTRIKTELTQMHDHLQKSLQLWQSAESKPKYEQRKQRWDDAADSMPHSLAIASNTLQEITLTMRKTDNNIANSW